MKIICLDITAVASERAPDGKLMPPKTYKGQVWESEIPATVDAWLRTLLKMEE